MPAQGDKLVGRGGAACSADRAIKRQLACLEWVRRSTPWAMLDPSLAPMRRSLVFAWSALAGSILCFTP